MQELSLDSKACALWIEDAFPWPLTGGCRDRSLQNTCFATEELSLLLLGHLQPGIPLLAIGSQHPGAGQPRWPTFPGGGHRGRFWLVQSAFLLASLPIWH